MDQMRNLLWDVNAMLTLRKWHPKKGPPQDDDVQVKGGILDLAWADWYFMSGTLPAEELPFLLNHFVGAETPASRIKLFLWGSVFVSAEPSFITSVLRFTLDIVQFK